MAAQENHVEIVRILLANHARGDLQTDVRRPLRTLRNLRREPYKNSSGDEIANVNFYAVRPEATRIRWNNGK